MACKTHKWCLHGGELHCFLMKACLVADVFSLIDFLAFFKGDGFHLSLYVCTPILVGGQILAIVCIMRAFLVV